MSDVAVGFTWPQPPGPHRSHVGLSNMSGRGTRRYPKMPLSMQKMIDDDNPYVLEIRMTDLLLENKARASSNFHNFHRHVCRADGKESDFLEFGMSYFPTSLWPRRTLRWRLPLPNCIAPWVAACTTWVASQKLLNSMEKLGWFKEEENRLNTGEIAARSICVIYIYTLNYIDINISRYDTLCYSGLGQQKQLCLFDFICREFRCIDVDRKVLAWWARRRCIVSQNERQPKSAFFWMYPLDYITIWYGWPIRWFIIIYCISFKTTVFKICGFP